MIRSSILMLALLVPLLLAAGIPCPTTATGGIGCPHLSTVQDGEFPDLKRSENEEVERS